MSSSLIEHGQPSRLKTKEGNFPEEVSPVDAGLNVVVTDTLPRIKIIPEASLIDQLGPDALSIRPTDALNPLKDKCLVRSSVFGLASGALIGGTSYAYKRNPSLAVLSTGLSASVMFGLSMIECRRSTRAVRQAQLSNPAPPLLVPPPADEPMTIADLAKKKATSSSTSSPSSSPSSPSSSTSHSTSPSPHLPTFSSSDTAPYVGYSSTSAGSRSPTVTAVGGRGAHDVTDVVYGPYADLSRGYLDDADRLRMNMEINRERDIQIKLMEERRAAAHPHHKPGPGTKPQGTQSSSSSSGSQKDDAAVPPEYRTSSYINKMMSYIGGGSGSGGASGSSGSSGSATSSAPPLTVVASTPSETSPVER